MPLWLKSTSAASRPKYLVDDENSDHSRSDALATTRGWEMRAGTKSQGNDNTSADNEILACIGSLSVTMAEANVLSVTWDATTTLAHDGTGTFDMTFACDEAVTVTSAAYAGGSTETNHWYFIMDCLGPTDMISDGNVTMQYYSGSGTNKITFRGQVPVAAVSDGYLGFQAQGSSSRDCQMVTNGTAAVVDGNGTTCTWADQKLFGSSAGAGVDHSSSIFGTSSGSVAVLTGVQFA